MTLEDWFNKGITAQEYVESMTTLSEELIYIYEHFKVPSEDEHLYEQLQKQNLRVIVLTEDWCSDAMLNIPILLKIAEAGHMNVHMLYRDENPELMDQYLTGKSRAIPIFIFINPEGKEVARWGPRAKEVQKFIDRSRKALPSKDKNDYEKKEKEMFQFITKAYRDNQEFWNDSYQSLKKAII
ncbi:thioredoxin family protein [Thalassobacillus pellis]|uniref:thioredoxin family protein n=1 Tax=Thalassobacillus pellis TaxID=748008 RepID=UPI00195F814F|nr:thioredoxin family protein [Thalassobacillus pellis]MBM7554790.1 hypothetical protein [Thalassobacillus pellis]